MNTKQQNTLRGLLRKYGFKDVSNRVRKIIGINYDNFLTRTEPLYVIPRIASCYVEEDKKKELNSTVYKEWLKDVVDNRWVAAVNEYINEHGERTVLQAIYSLVDGGLWDVYEGRLALDASEVNYYDKLDDMPSAIAIVQEEMGKEEKTEEQPKEEQPEETASITESDTIPNADEAIALLDATKKMCSAFNTNFDKLADFLYTSADTTPLRNKIAQQQKEIEELNRQMTDGCAIIQKQNDYISKLSQEAKEAQKEYDTLNAKYKKALDERDDADRELAECKKILEAEEQKDLLPKKKVIPYSALDSVPLLGKAVMTGLVPVLDKYHIAVDYNR